MRALTPFWPVFFLSNRNKGLEDLANKIYIKDVKARKRGSIVKLTGNETSALVLLAQKPTQKTRLKLHSELCGSALRMAKVFMKTKPSKSLSSNERHLAKLFTTRAKSLKAR